MTPSRNLLVHIRLMIRWQLGPVVPTHQVTLPRQDSRMSLKLIGPREDIPRGFQEVGAHITLEIETSTLLDLGPTTPSEEQWGRALGRAVACIPPSMILCSEDRAETVDMTPEHHPVPDTILLALVNRPLAAIEARSVEDRAEGLAGSEVGSAATLSERAVRTQLRSR